ncbi:hypothetical protein FKW77_004049 [Venturia effusa]|uniref:Uncharacterized protein n=1 Tax=Venturia effusa TaxID=50376 RepID=A0A517LML9_9PEZI|nr:hypothetical protein FKW77_004049 [Venturia effusa]
MSNHPKPVLTTAKTKSLLHTLTLSTPQALLNAINKHKSKQPTPETKPPPVLRAVQQKRYLLLFFHEENMIPSVLALDCKNRPVQVTTVYESLSLDQDEDEEVGLQAMLDHPCILNILTTLQEHVASLIAESAKGDVKELKYEFKE